MLKERLLKLFWVFSEKFGLILLSTVSFLIFATQLSTEELGIAVLSVSIVELIGLLMTSSLEDPFVRKNTISKLDDSTLYWGGIGLSLLSILLIYMGTIIFVQDQYFKNLILVASIKLPFLLGSRVHVAHLRRSGEFKSLMLRTLLGKFLGGFTGISLALYGYGPWAIVLQAVVMEVFSFLVLKIVDKRVLRIYINFKFLFDLLSTGIFITFKAISWELMGRGVNIVLGATSGASAVGIFNIAQRLVDLPRTAIYGGVMNYALPVLSRRKQSIERLKEFYINASSISFLFLFPMFIGLFLVAPDVLQVIFNGKWDQSIPTLEILCVFTAVNVFFLFNGSLLVAVNKPQLTIVSEVIASITAILFLFFVGSSFGAIGGALAIFLRFLLTIPVMLKALKIILNLQAKDLFFIIYKPVFSTIIMSLTLLVYSNYIYLDLNWFGLVSKIVLGLVVYVLTIIIFWRSEIIRILDFFRNA